MVLYILLPWLVATIEVVSVDIDEDNLQVIKIQGQVTAVSCRLLPGQQQKLLSQPGFSREHEQGSNWSCC